MVVRDNRVTVEVRRSDGQTFRVGSGTGWKIPNDGLKDWNVMEHEVSTAANVLTDGSSLVSKRLGEKDRTLRAVYCDVDADNERARAIAFFNPKFAFEAYVSYRGRTRWCGGEQIGFKVTTENVYAKPEITWTLLCLDPYMKDPDGNESAFGDSVPMLGWPYVSYADEEGLEYPPGLVAGVLVFDGLNSIVNGGDVETAYIVRIEAEGKLVNPTINKDGRFVRMLLTLSAGDVLEIDFESAPPSVTKNGQNVIHYASRDSAFTKMQMQVGKNVFSFTVDNEENRSLAKVQVLFHEKFLGV
ncbi:MAG: phage tail family protein [Clostridia bacterium]|nr:phage tail family protein [Clostridia bacterium]